MTESQHEDAEMSRRPRWWRYLIDIIVLVGMTSLLDAALGAPLRAPD
jgi:hypothetical protein